MLVNTISPIKLNTYNTLPARRNFNITPLRQDTVSFGSTQTLHSAEDLMEKIVNIYGKADAQQLLKRVLKDTIKNNFSINSGQYSKFYTIPNINEYGLKISFPIEKTYREALEGTFERSDDLFPFHNFGQSVITNNKGVYFLKKVNGVPNSIDNWNIFYEHPEKLTDKHAQIYLEKILKLSEFPQKSINNFVQNIKTIVDKNSDLLDLINPNNIMVDFERKLLTPIDLDDTRGGLPFRNPIEIYECLADEELAKQYNCFLNNNEILAAEKARNKLFSKVITAIREVFS